MKNKILSILTILSIFVLVGCAKAKPTDSIPTPNPNNNSSPQEESKDSETPTEEPKNEKPKNEEPSTEKPKEDPKPEQKEPVVQKRNSRIYAFNADELALYYYDTTIDVVDNALVTALTKELQTNLPNDSFLALTDKIGVTSATLDEKEGVLKIVFSDSFVDHMLLGSSTESGLLSSLICTYGYNYDVDKVSIYFKDKLYTSLKGELEAGAFEVNYSEAKEYKNN